MSDKKQLRILLVDDEPDKVSQFALNLRTRFKVAAPVRIPKEVELIDLRQADLILIDHDLGSGKNSFDPQCAPNGFALASVLRQYLRDDEQTNNGSSPTGLALLTAKLGEAAYPLTKVTRRHLLARHNNLEWVFEKKDERLAEQVVSLARAIRVIPKSWADGIQDIKEVASQLGLGSDPARLELFEAAIEPCHPPIYELTRWSHGLAFVRWLLHDILMYPCFLWDSVRVAARLRIQHETLISLLKGRSQLARRLLRTAYRGILHDFAGPRWWRHEVEALVWEITNGQTQDAEHVRVAVSRLAGKRIQPSDHDQPLVCVDENYQALPNTFMTDEAVRVQPDDWPPFADTAWMPKKIVRAHKHLQSLVFQDDRAAVK